MASLPARERLKKFLDDNDFTRDRFAKKMGIGHSSVVTHWVRGSRRPGLNNALKIEAITGIPAGLWTLAPAVPQRKKRAA